MGDEILITELNDFIFCPVSIYFHRLYGPLENMTYQSSTQINGSAAHEAVDHATYSSEKDIIMGLDVFCEEYGLIGKIDIYNKSRHILRERKKKIKNVYDGYIFQAYAQCFALREMGYKVDAIELYSMDDHNTYKIDLPEENEYMLRKFKKVVEEIRQFRIEEFIQNNGEKCRKCIYEAACDRSVR